MLKRRNRIERAYSPPTKYKPGETEKKQITAVQKDFIVMESYRTARTNIIYTMVDAGSCKKIVITSAMSGDGKTTTCLNLAITFAQLGAKVLLIEADLRLPKAQQYLEVKAKVGLSDVLAGLVELEKIIIHKNGIDFLPAGSIPQAPSEMLSSKKMAEIMEQLSEDYDYIFIDTPPAALMTDAIMLAKLADGVILVARKGHTRIRDIKAVIDAIMFAEAKILGFILNDTGLSRFSYRKSYNYYNYSYSYAGRSVQPPRGSSASSAKPPPQGKPQ